jgi:hypothetical protein
MVRVLARQLHDRRSQYPFGCWLSAEPFSYRNFFVTMMTKTPVQSAIVFLKNEPMWVEGLDQR